MPEQRDEQAASASDLAALPGGTVILGPSWSEEVYAADGYGQWWAPGSEAPWSAKALAHRGPFVVLHRGGEELPTDRERIDRRDELAYLVKQAIESTHMRYDDDDWTRIADSLLEQGWTRTRPAGGDSDG